VTASVRDRDPGLGAGAQSEDPPSLAAVLTAEPETRSSALAARIATLVSTLAGSPPPGSPETSLATLDRIVGAGGRSEVWLALAVLTGRLPDSTTVARTARAVGLDGACHALYEELRRNGQLDDADWPAVEVVVGRVTVDVDHTRRAPFATGIQRVARELTRRWARDHDLILVGWTEGFTALRRLDPAEADVVVADDPSPASRPGGPAADRVVLVPWHGTHLVPELPAEPGRGSRYQALAAHSGCTIGVVAYDCVPLTMAETTGAGMPGAFAAWLAAAARVDRLAAISAAAAGELRGWKAMLAGAGLSGPEVAAIPLAVERRTPTDADIAEARRLVAVGDLPVVLSVGSHEPRKNHLALVQAAETLWKEGRLFSLALLGGNAWNSGGLDAEMDRLARDRRPIQTFRGLPDRLLWAAYRVAHCTVFPSLHEGFGLPVVESLASGTPVVTSAYGSMRDNAAHGGALLVDPRDPDELTDALRRLLDDPNLRRRLAAEARRLPARSWDDYATEVWEFLTIGKPAAGADR
jgi:glycosyltransferase involved in cell wall biosynthesis